MSEYKGIKGFQVQTRTEDPVPYAQALADNPYAGTWASGANLNTGRGDSWAGAGTQTSALGFGGFVPPGTGHKALTEQWDGSSWTEVNDLNTSRDEVPGAGSSTSALVSGGNTPGNVVEGWNGTSWTEVAELGSARNYAGSAGSVSAAFVAGDSPHSSTAANDTEEFTSTDFEIKTITTS